MPDTAHLIHRARVTNPIRFMAPNGREATIPVGPCLLETLSPDLVDVVWGPAGERSAVLPAVAAEQAEREGQLVVID